MIPNSDMASYRNRKGFVSQNVLAAYNFDLQFMYVLSGWEGSAHDSKILSNALTRNTCRLEVPEGILLADCTPYKKYMMFVIYMIDVNHLFPMF